MTTDLDWLDDAADAINEGLDDVTHTGRFARAPVPPWARIVTLAILAALVVTALSLLACHDLPAPSPVPPLHPACVGDVGFESPICDTGYLAGMPCRVCDHGSACFAGDAYCVDKAVQGGGGCFECSDEMAKRRRDGGAGDAAAVAP